MTDKISPEEQAALRDPAVMTAAAEAKTGRLTRLTVNLTPRSSAALDLAAGLGEDSKTDTVNRALQVYAYLMKVVHDRKGQVYVREEEGGELDKLVILLCGHEGKPPGSGIMRSMRQHECLCGCLLRYPRTGRSLAGWLPEIAVTCRSCQRAVFLGYDGSVRYQEPDLL